MTFIDRTLGAAALAVTLLGSTAAWAASVGPQIAVQLWTTRNSGTPAEQLALIKAAGVNYVETFGNFGGTGAEAKILLDSFGMAAISAHTDLGSLRSDIGAVIARQQAMGNSTIVLPYIAPADRPADEAGWAALGTELGGYAATMAAAGMTFGYHNHDFDLVQFNGRTAVEIMLEAAGPLLKTQVDIGWVAAAGLDPLDYLAAVTGQVISIHAKDVADPADPGPTAGGMAAFGFDFAAVGDGVIDWAAVLPAAGAAGAGWFIIEHDFPPDAFLVVSRSNAYLTAALAPVPVPAALPLLGGGLAALALYRRMRR